MVESHQWILLPLPWATDTFIFYDSLFVCRIRFKALKIIMTKFLSFSGGKGAKKRWSPIGRQVSSIKGLEFFFFVCRVVSFCHGVTLHVSVIVQNPYKIYNAN